VCGLQLTLKTFSRALSDDSSKEIYCRTHVPKINATSVGGDAVGIRTALDAQKQASDKVSYHFVCIIIYGATENARTENAAPSKMQGWKTRDWKMRHQCVGGWKMRDQMLWNAENAITNKTVK